jgi:hypothetical protein
MNQSVSAVIIFVLVIVLLIFIAIVVSNLLMKRALRNVIKMFRDKQALSPETAKYQDELGIKPKSFFQFGMWRDYRIYALQILLKNQIVQMTEGRRIYLSEQALSATNIEKNAK